MIQDIGVRIVAHQICAVPLAVAVAYHRTADVVVELVHHCREVAVHRTANALKLTYYVHVGVGILVEPVADHLHNDRVVFNVAARARGVGEILAGVRIPAGRTARIVLHDATASIETGHIGQIVIPILRD